jgi:hypothetical protein
MKTANFLLIISFICLFIANLHSQTILVLGTINSNTTWSADTVKITGDVSVLQGAMLTIDPGTYIEAQGYYRINVFGVIRAIGAPTDTIVFTVLDTANFWQDTTSVSGGWAGINIVSSDASTDTSIFEFCKIQFAKKYNANGIDINGGAIFASDYGALTVKNSLLHSNMVICYLHLPCGGAIYCKNVNYVTIENNRFTKNRSFARGGGIYIDEQCQSVIANNIFIHNTALYWNFSLFVTIGGSGAAIYTSDDLGYSPTICNNYCFNNLTANGIIYTTNRNALVFNNVICNNFAGSGIMDGHQLSISRIYNNTITNNKVYNGGIYLASRAKVYNNICWGNETFPGYSTDQIQKAAFSIPQLFYNCVQFGDGGPNSTNVYPEFTNPTNGVGLSYNGWEADWSLVDLSVSVNRGTPDTAELYIPLTDIVGNSRIYPSRIDLGAFENNSLWLNDDNNTISSKAIAYPNPGSDNFTIEAEEQLSGAQFTLYDIQGRPVLAEKIVDTQLRVNTSGLSTGSYPWQIVYKNKVVESGKWVKE